MRSRKYWVLLPQNSWELEQVTLQSENIEVRINLAGAELCSYKRGGQEYIWQANPKVWARHAPILFPFVGKLKDNTYHYKGRSYPMGQHGFARDKRFVLVSQDETSAVFRLTADADTLRVYPFLFELLLRYALIPDGLSLDYEVLNPSDEDLLFSIGAHPGFCCPLSPDRETLRDYTLDFHDKGLHKLSLYPLENGHIAKGKKELPLEAGRVALSDDLFADDALIVDVHPAAKVSIVNEKTGKGFGMSFPDFRWLGLWSKEASAGFVCIEPWNGIADTADHNQQLEDKLGINRLSPGKTYVVNQKLFFW